MTKNRISPSLFWNIIGDSFSRAFDIAPKREIEGVWKSMLDQASDGVSYANHIGSLATPFTADFLAPWGTLKVDLQDVSDISQQQAIMAGEKYIWSLDPIPSSGYVSSDLAGGQFSKISQIQLGSGGYLSLCDLPASIDPGIGSSMEDWEDRFSLTGSIIPVLTDDGLTLDLPWVQWSILADNIDNSPVEAWENVVVMNITRWDSGGATERGISINSIANFGADWEIKLFDNGSNAGISYGTYAITTDSPLTLSGNTISRGVGSFRDDGFRSGMYVTLYNTPHDGSYLITAASAYQLTLEGATFGASATHVTAQLRTHLSTAHEPAGLRDILRGASEESPVLVELVMQYRPSTATLSGGVAVNGVFYSVPEMPVAIGSRKQIIDIYNQAKTISATILTHFYKSGTMMGELKPTSVNIGENYSYIYTFSEPVLDAKRLQVCPWDIRPTASVVSWNGDSLVVDIDEEYFGFAPEACIVYDETFVLESLSGSRAVYSPQGIVDIDISGDVTLRPWFCDEFTFIEPGKVSINKKAPLDYMFILGSKAVEVDLYETFGKLLQVSKQPDSLEYLNIIRGVHFGLMSRPTPNNIANAVSAICGAPYSIYPGVIESITVNEGELGQELSVDINISGNITTCDPYWREFLLPVGSSVSMMESLVDATMVYDWISDPDKVDNRLEDKWRKWSTFFVDISDSLGVTAPSAAAIFSMLNRCRARHTTFEVGITSSRGEHPTEELLRNNAFSQTETASSIVQPHSIEDMTFDDYGEVVNNAMNFQSVSGNDYSEEYQFGSNDHLDSYMDLDMGQCMDVLRISDPMVLSDGQMKWRSRPRKNESSYGKDFLGLYESFGPKPSSILRCYEGETTNLATYYSGMWYEKDTSNVSSVFIEGDDLAYASSGTNIITSYDKGNSWSTMAVSGASGSATKVKSGFGIGMGANKIWIRSAGTWSEATHSNIDENATAIAVRGSNVWAFWPSGSNIWMTKSTNGGASFAPPSLVASPAPVNVNDAFFVTDDVGYLATGYGLYSTNDGGLSWGVLSTFTGCGSIAYADDIDKLLVSEEGGGGLLSINNASSPIASVTGYVLTGAASILEISAGKNYAFIVESSGVFKSNDYGETWSSATTGISGSISSVSVGGDTGLFRIAGGDSIWVWF